MPVCHRSRTAWLVAVLTLMAGGRAAATEPGSPQITETIEVRVVNVDVYVTDRKGRPVTDLSREDFALEVDGKPTPITHFFAAGSGPEPTPPPSIADSPETSLPELPSTAADPLHAILYLDSYAMAPAHRERILDDLEAFAAGQTGETVRFMVVAHDPGLRVLAPFTTSIDEIRAALAAAGETPARGFNAILAYRRALDEIADLYRVAELNATCPDPCDCAWHQMLATRDVYAAETTGRQERSRDGLGEVVRSLAGLEGRKALFYVSSGLEQYPGVDLIRYMSDVCPRYEREFQMTLFRWDDTSRIEELAADANANRVTLYPLDAAGLRGEDAADVSHIEHRFRVSPRVSQIRRSNLEAGQFVLADRTGGRAVLHANAPAAALDDLAQDFSHYYSLAFAPEGPADGKRHRIQVALVEDRKGIELRFRHSYRDKTRAERQVERTLTALHWDERDNPLGAQVALGPEQRRGRTHLVPVEITLPEAGLTRIGEQPARVHVTLAAHDLATGRTDLREKHIELAPPGKGARHRLSIEIELEAGSYRFAAGVRDEISGLASYLALASAIPAAPE